MSISFAEFREYCSKLVGQLNKNPCYSSCYKVVSNPFLKEHDAQYLQVTLQQQHYFLKINLLYSIAYQIPIFLFMVYELETMKPCQPQQVHQVFMSNSKQLHPKAEETGIHLCQNQITQQQFYGLHNCQLNMPLQFLVPFYFSLLGLHPILNLDAEDEPSVNSMNM